MEKSPNYDAFVSAYNDFDPQPLQGDRLDRFYVEDFTRELTEEIVTTIRISERFKKLLVIGHRGCGKSTILNKISQILKDEYHIVSFSAADVVNMGDVETVDILLLAYLKVLQSLQELQQREPKGLEPALKEFEKLIGFARKKLNLAEVGTGLPGILSFKFMVEAESRAAIRHGLRTQIEALQDNLSDVCRTIRTKSDKDVLIIIDDLDKLETRFAERIFFEDSHLLVRPEVKTVYTFPLDTYYCDAYIRTADRYVDEFIPLVALRDYAGNSIESNILDLKKLILQRISADLVTEEALQCLVEMSGGLLRDLVKFMQDACKLAIVGKTPEISLGVAEAAVAERINDYYRVFDFAEYEEKVRFIAESQQKTDNSTLVYLLRYLFALEYRSGAQIWYDVHPCLKKALEKINS